MKTMILASTGQDIGLTGHHSPIQQSTHNKDW